MERVEETIQDVLASKSESLGALLKHVSLFGGKRLRPALIIIISKALGSTLDDHVKLGAVVELIHTSSLVHDDILDSAVMRRRVESVNQLHDNHISVLLGDLIYARAFKLSLTLSTQRAANLLSSVTEQICSGEIEQNFSRGVFDLHEDLYFKIIEAKTASLYGAACRLSAEYSGCNEDVAAKLEQYGLSLGIAFQIVDDCLDIVGDEDTVGKSLGTDAERGKMTLPLLRLSKSCSDNELKRLKEIFYSDELTDKNNIIKSEFDIQTSVEQSFESAGEYINRGLKALSVLEDSLFKDAMKTAAEFVLHRKL